MENKNNLDFNQFKILNLTLHKATEDQRMHGVVDISPEKEFTLKTLLNFTKKPTREEIIERAERIAELAKSENVTKAMIGGALWLIGPLTEALRKRGITPVFAYSERVVQETILEDGTVQKTSQFKHRGFVEAV